MYLWRIEKQLWEEGYWKYRGCDLLSNCIFDVLKNNWLIFARYIYCVVICFQIVSLTYWKTTQTEQVVLHISLWFAFKLYLWRIEKQRAAPHGANQNSCDLLSNCIFDVLKNNKLWNEIPKMVVVICFQIVSLTYWKTTQDTLRIPHNELWFAFKLYLWRIEKQQRR